MTKSAIASRIRNLCHILRDDGITYHQYATELTYLLLLKMMVFTHEVRAEPPASRQEDEDALPVKRERGATNEQAQIPGGQGGHEWNGWRGPPAVQALFASTELAEGFDERARNDSNVRPSD